MNSRQRNRHFHICRKKIVPLLKKHQGLIADAFTCKYGPLKGFSREALEQLVKEGLIDSRPVVYPGREIIRGIQQSFITLASRNNGSTTY